MKKILSALFILLILPSLSLALTWDEALLLAEQNSNELKSAQKQLESSEWTYRKSFSAFMPQLSASAGMTETISTTTAATARSYSYGLNATQYLFRGMAGIYGIQSAGTNVEYQKANLQTTKASVLYDVRSAFISLLVTQENINLLEKIFKQRKENTRLIQLRYESGREDKGNLMTTKADEAKAKYDLAATKRDLKLAQLKLSQLLQHDVGKADDPRQLKALDKVDLEQLLKTTPTYVNAQKNLESAELNQKASISGFLPSLSLSGNYRNRGANWPPTTENASWSLNVSYALFPGGSNIAARAISGAELDKAKEEFKQTIKDLHYGLEEAHKNYQDAIESLEVAEISRAASQERAKITGTKYLNGLTGYDEWYRIENAYIQAQKSLLTTRKTALLAEAFWHKTYGGHIK